MRCEIGEVFACRCADGALGAQTCMPFDVRPEGVLSPCVCVDGGVGRDAGTPEDSPLPVPDASWPDGCTPLRCETLGCGTHTAACGIAVECGPCEATFRTLDIEARHLLWDERRELLYVSVPSSEPRGNTVSAVDPLTVDRPFDIVVGSEPGAMAMSEDGSTLYVGLEGAGALRRVDLERREANLEILHRADTFVGDLATIPGQPDSVVVSLRGGRPDGSMSFDSLWVFDGAVARRDVVEFGHGEAFWVEVLDASTALGISEDTSGLGGVSTFAVDEEGLREVASARVMSMGLGDVEVSAGLVYSPMGQLVDPASWTVLHRFGASGAVAVDDAHARVYFLGRGPGSWLRDLVAFDLATREERGRVQIGVDVMSVTPPGAAIDLIVWRAAGHHGIAYLEGAAADLRPTRLVIVETNLVLP